MSWMGFDVAILRAAWWVENPSGHRRPMIRQSKGCETVVTLSLMFAPDSEMIVSDLRGERRCERI
jgi:hypothetical protein